MLPSNEWCRITHGFTGPGVPTGAAIVYCVHVDAAQPPLETAEVAHGFFGTIMMPLISQDVTLVETTAKEGPDNTGGASTTSAPTYTGALSTSSLAPNTAMLVVKHTAEGGRRGRGRIFLPACGENDTIDGGVLDAPYHAALQDACQAWYEALGPGGIPMALEHGPEYTWTIFNGQPRRVPVAGAIPNPTPVTSLVASATLATQRRRLRR